MAFPTLPKTNSRTVRFLADLLNLRLYDGTNASATGAQTINKYSGQVQFAISATSLVVTNNKVTPASRVIATVNSNDSTLKSVSAVAGAGTITLTANAAPTAIAKVSFLVLN